MPYRFTDRIRNAWNAFKSRDPTRFREYPTNSSYGVRPDRNVTHTTSDRSIIEMIKNRIAVDVAQLDVRHVKVDDEENYLEDIADSQLNELFHYSANVDQTGRAFMQDVVQSMLDEGYVAAVPIDTDVDPMLTDSYNILSMRVGKIVKWQPYTVTVEVYNERRGNKEEITVPKETTVIVQNPFYEIMNSPNSTLQRLIRTLRNLDVLNDQNASGKMDLIIQLPYSLKSPLKQQQAETRRKQIEMQLVGSQYGIAYTDAAERITQLNRPVENNLWKEASDLTAMLYNQLGLTQSVFDGTASKDTMNYYYIRTVYPILTAITEEMQRKFLSKTARTQKQRIIFKKDPFMYTGMNELATVGQIFVQNEVMSSNEVRSKIGLAPRDTERANELLNKNINKVEDPSKLQKGTGNRAFEDSDKNFQSELTETNNIKENDDG